MRSSKDIHLRWHNCEQLLQPNKDTTVTADRKQQTNSAREPETQRFRRKPRTKTRSSAADGRPVAVSEDNVRKPRTEAVKAVGWSDESRDGKATLNSNITIHLLVNYLQLIICGFLTSSM
jgi:hypothetical protein